MPDFTMERYDAPVPTWEVFSGGTCLGTVRRASRGLYVAESSIDDVEASAGSRADAAAALYSAWTHSPASP